jgi:hypothetical protein
MKKNIVSQKLAKVFQCSTEEVDRVLPPGDVSIVETVGVTVE